MGRVVRRLREPDANVWLVCWRSLVQVGVLILDKEDSGPARKITIIELKGDFLIALNVFTKSSLIIFKPWRRRKI